MSDVKTVMLLAARKQMKQKKPVFIMHEAGQRKELPLKWRKPRGKSNKRRLNRKGHAKKPSLGFRSPEAVRGMHGTGTAAVLVHNSTFTATLPEGIIIARRVGKKKRAAIISTAQAAGIRILNLSPAAPAAPAQEAAK